MLRFGENSSGAEVTVPLGEEFEISLDENRTTGFRWITEQRGSPFCSLLEEHASAPPRRPGAGGTHLWHFRAEHPGVGTIEMRYRRLWETEQGPARTFRMLARVTE